MKYYIVTALVILSISQHINADDLIEINNIWINEAPPTVSVFAGYLTIVNHSDDQIKLINATSPLFEKIEFHKTQFEDGLVRMNRQKIIIIPANSVFTFSPGDYHLMLFNNYRTIKTSDNLSISFEFGNGIKKTVSAEIRKPAAITHHH